MDSYIYRLSAFVVGFVALTACSSVPKVSIDYHLAQTDLTAKVTRTVTCSTSDEVFVTNVVEITPTHSANPSKKFSFDLSAIGSALADGSTTFELYADGRLKGVNASTVGQGEAIAKAAISFATGPLGLAGAPAAHTAACDAINGGNDAKRDGSALIIYEQTNLTANATYTAGTPLTLSAKSGYSHWDALLSPIIGDVTVKRASETQRQSLKGADITRFTCDPAATAVKPNDDHAFIVVSEPKVTKIEVTIGGVAGAASTVWTGERKVAQSNTCLAIPVSRGAAFGETSFDLTLGDAGQVTKIGYGAKSGTSQLFGAATALGNELDGKSTAEKVAEAKNEADLIAQTTRLNRCRAEPSECK